MKVLSLATRMGLLALGMILVSVLSADAVWADASEDEPTTSGLADALLTDWALPLLILGVLDVDGHDWCRLPRSRRANGEPLVGIRR